MRRPHTFMEPELFKKVVDEVASYDVRTWLHFMGEPLMHPHIFELIDYASGKELPYFGMSSNGVLLTEENSERILDSGLHRFEISLDSLSPELLGKLRPGRDPTKIIQNAHTFFERKYRRQQKRPITSVAIREMSENAEELERFTSHWNGILKEPDFVMSIRYDSWGGHEDQEHSTWKVPAERLPCLKLWNTSIVLADGRLVTCNGKYDAQLVMGDTQTSSIREIWEGEKYRDVRQKHLDGRAHEVPVCGECGDGYQEAGPKQYNNRTPSSEN